MQQDIDTMKKRHKIKCDVVLELEEKVKKQSSDMLQLQDEVLAWKMHASRKDDSLIQQRPAPANEQVVQELPATVVQGKVNGKKAESRERASTSMSNHDRPVIDVEAIPDKKSVMLIGTSNIKYIDSNRLSICRVKMWKYGKLQSIPSKKDRNI